MIKLSLENEYFKAYDIEKNQNDLTSILIYKVYLINDNKQSFYRFIYVKTLNVGSLEEKQTIKNLRSNGYHSLNEFGVSNNILENYNILANYILTLFGNRIKILDKIYFPEIRNNNRYLKGAIIFMDVKTGDKYFLKVRNFGCDNSLDKYNDIELKGYKYITETIYNDLNMTDNNFKRILSPKD